MKKFIFVITLFTTHALIPKKIILESPIIRIVDGTAVGPEVIGQLLKIRADAKRIRKTAIYTIDEEGYTVKELIALEERNLLNTDQLDVYLVPAKDDFSLHVAPFLDHAQETKYFMVSLIQEWAEKAERPDSLLLLWSTVEPGTEQDMFAEKIISFAVFDRFCADLISFLETMINSCKKARERFRRDYLS